MEDHLLTVSIRQNLLERAIDLTCGDRNKTYGDPTNNMTRLAALMNAYLGDRMYGGVESPYLTPVDAAAFNVLIKLSRVAANPGHYDSWLDMAAYAAIGAETALNTISKET